MTDAGRPTIDGFEVGERERSGRVRRFRGRHLASGAEVTIEVLDASTTEDRRVRLQREALTVASLAPHPSLVRLIGAGHTSAAEPYVAMERPASGDLATAVDRWGSMPWREALRAVIATADALAAAHDLGVVHGDIGPHHVWVGAAGEYALGGFGLGPDASDVEPGAGADVASLGGLFAALAGADAPVPAPVAAVLAEITGAGSSDAAVVRDRLVDALATADQQPAPVHEAAGVAAPVAALDRPPESAAPTTGTDSPDSPDQPDATIARGAVLSPPPLPSPSADLDPTIGPAATAEATAETTAAQPVAPLATIPGAIDGDPVDAAPPAGAADHTTDMAGLAPTLSSAPDDGGTTVDPTVGTSPLAPAGPVAAATVIGSPADVDPASAPAEAPDADAGEPPAEGSGGGRRKGLLVAAAIVLVLALGGGAFAMTRDDSSPSSATMPDVMGMDSAAALAELDEIGLADDQVSFDFVFSEDAVGEVVGQRPDAGEAIGPDDQVTLEVGAEGAEVPDVAGLDVDEATAALEEAGFEVEVRRAHSESKPVDQVARQDPVAGATAGDGSTVLLVVSDGPEPREVPDLVAGTEPEAVAALRELGLDAKVERREAAEPPGTVLSQDPAEGAEVDKGSVVTIVVSSGPTPTTTAAPESPTTTAPRSTPTTPQPTSPRPTQPRPTVPPTTSPPPPPPPTTSCRTVPGYYDPVTGEYVPERRVCG